MIKYYDTEAAYKAASKSDFESQVSLIGADNSCRYDGRNVIVGLRSAATGSVAVLDGAGALHFIAPRTFGSKSFMSNYTVVGVVVVGVDHRNYRGEVMIMNKEFTSRKMSDIYSHALTGYTLDGSDRTAVLSVRQATDSWAANHDYTVSYNASDVDGLVAQLNDFFAANEPFKAQEWRAVKESDGGVTLQYLYTAWQQASYNSGKSGWTLTANLLPEWKATITMLRANGRRNGEGTITNWPRALAYFRNDNSSTSYNPSSDVSTTKLSYPICLPGYLGTSQYQSDHCAYLRGVYGEGEDGWLRFMRSFLPVRPDSYGAHDKATYGDAMRNTYLLAAARYTGADGVERPVSPAAYYVANTGYGNEALAKRKWVMADSDLIFDLVGDLEYPTTPDRTADLVNEALQAIGSPALGNNSYVWSCSRYVADSGWYAGGGVGFAANNILYGSSLAVPLLLLKVPKGAA